MSKDSKKTPEAMPLREARRATQMMVRALRGFMAVEDVLAAAEVAEQRTAHLQGQIDELIAAAARCREEAEALTAARDEAKAAHDAELAELTRQLDVVRADIATAEADAEQRRAVLQQQIEAAQAHAKDQIAEIGRQIEAEEARLAETKAAHDAFVRLATAGGAPA